MRARRDREGGLTIVELLVVLSIIGLIGSLSIPVLARMGLFGGRTTELASRELFSMLKAAKIYATTHNVETAVAYSVIAPEDSVTGAPAPIMDGMILLRRLKRAELDAGGEALRTRVARSLLDQCDCVSDTTIRLCICGAPISQCSDACREAREVFVPVQNREGGFRKFSNRTGILLKDLLVFASKVESQQEYIFRELTGLTTVAIYDPEGDRFITPRLMRGPFEPLFSEWEGLFPAHVFLPSGEIESESSKQRVALYVGLYPDADPEDRLVDYVDPATGEVGRTDVAVKVLLYMALGRVKLETRWTPEELTL